MKKPMMIIQYLPLWLCLLAMTISCAAAPPARETPRIAGNSILPPEAMGVVPEKPAIPSVPEYIMGEGLISAKDMAAFLLDFNPMAEMDFVEDLSLLYTEEAGIEGVNHDAAFAQMCLETGFLSYGNLVTPDMNNFCGLGSTGIMGPDGPERGLVFPDPRTGVRAHIQHLKAYATETPLAQELVDPRYRYVRLGSSPKIMGLAGTWASDRSYGEKMNDILERLYSFSFLGESGIKLPLASLPEIPEQE